MRILVLEDSKSTQLLLQKRLEKEGLYVDCVDNGRQGFQYATSHVYDAVISDIRMPHWDGLKFIEAMQVVCPHLPVIIVSSAHDDRETALQLEQFANVEAVLSKPLDFNNLFAILSTLKNQTHLGINKKARIVCTVGPVSSSEKMIGQMIVAGMDVVRLNFSHGSHKQHEKALVAIRTAEKKWHKPIAVLQDLCGPKIRIGRMEDEGVLLVKGSQLKIVKEEVVGSAECISTIVPEIVDDLCVGDPLLIDDGLLELKVIEQQLEGVVCEVVVGGLLKSGKGINLPATALSLPSVTAKDWDDLKWALDHSVDYIALSFVRSSEEIIEIQDYIRAVSDKDIKVIAKVEKPEAVNDIRAIVEAADGIMIARGDMGVELPAARVPRIQKEIIRLCWEMNKPVITATQMLDSMTTHYRPTRAEVTDVSTAIGEGTDAVMLSQETATGIDPVNTIRTMASIITEEELHQVDFMQDKYDVLLREQEKNPVLTSVWSINTTAATLLLDPGGEMYPVLSKWSRTVPTLLLTSSKQVARHSSLYRNIIPIIIEDSVGRDALIVYAMQKGVEMGCFRKGDLVSIVEGARFVDGAIEQQAMLQLVKVAGV